MFFKFIRRHSREKIKWKSGGRGCGAWGEGGGGRGDSSPRRIQAAPLCWLSFVTSHSFWEASNIKSSKINRRIIIVTDYQTWSGKLQFFWYIEFWISDFSTFKTELQNSLLSNINDNGDNNEKNKKFKNSGENV